MFWGLLVVLAVTLVAIVGLYALSRASAVVRNPLITPPYTSGWLPEQHALSRYHARYYPVTLVFLAFDVEMLFMYPWSVVVARMGAEAVIEMFVFLGVLLCGVVWAWREGAFRWA